jgi:hydrogenase maturation protease
VPARLEELSYELLILGLGNLLCGDDGLGVAAIDRLAASYEAPPGVRILDGGTLGLSLIHWVSEAKRVILVDAIRAEAPPGTLVRLSGEAVSGAVRERLSVHQIGVADLLDGLRLIDRYPGQLVLLGLVPEAIELGDRLTPAIAASLPKLVDEVAAEAATLGFPLTPHAPNLDPDPLVGASRQPVGM